MGTPQKSEDVSGPGRRIYPALDGLRGIAILLVLICHYGALLPPSAAAISGFLEIGWIGVDLFFVLSGFLITGILFDAHGTPHYFRNFYARRMLRIFPLYYGFLVTLLLVLLALKFAGGEPLTSSSNESIQSLWSSQPWLWTYTANFWMALPHKWTGWTEMIMPLWSLSVEEQFYLLWPLAIFFFSQRALIRLCVGSVIVETLIRLILTASGTNWFALYTFTFTRADSLAAGALVALLIRLPDGESFARTIYKYAGPIAGFLLLLMGDGLDPTRHPWLRDLFYSILAVFFSALLFWSIDPVSLRGIPKRIHENRVLRVIGGYSYGIYIVHLPLMYLTKSLLARGHFYSPERYGWMTAALLLLLNVSLTGCIAFASFHLYEKHFLKLKRFFPERSVRR
jgi:peptidoglycan/LPS O-acetylase OafA/YrhL